MELKIGSKIYNIEYDVEASVCEECVEKITSFIMSIGNAEGKNAIKNIVDTLTDLPGTALSLLYAGLLEHHGEDGDGAVTNKADAKKLLKAYIKENADNEKGNYHYLIGAFIEQMEKDGFFKLIGLETVLKELTKPAKEVKTP